MKEELRKIQKDFEEYKAKYPAEDFVPDFVKEPVKHRHRRNGQKRGHKGYARKIPERIDGRQAPCDRKMSLLWQ